MHWLDWQGRMSVTPRNSGPLVLLAATTAAAATAAFLEPRSATNVVQQYIIRAAAVLCRDAGGEWVVPTRRVGQACG